MKVLLVLLVVATVAVSAHRLRSEEKWRPAKSRDMSKYIPKHPQMPARAKAVPWEIYRHHQTLKKHISPTQKSYAPIEKIDVRETCGQKPVKSKIVGGDEAEAHSWPWQVAVYIDGMYFCGGSLISQDYVLTAAHCADGAFSFDIVLGAHNVYDVEDSQVEVTSYDYVVHDDWDSINLANDVAIIKLPSSVSLTNEIGLACLPSGEPDVGSDVTCTGWGKPSDSASGISSVLREVVCPVISNSDCNDVYGIVGDGVVCIDTTGGKGTCNGDSGGPLNQEVGSKWEQVGIVSFGAAAGCEAGLPAGFSRTYHFKDYIQDQTGLI